MDAKERLKNYFMEGIVADVFTAEQSTESQTEDADDESVSKAAHCVFTLARRESARFKMT